MLIIIVFLKREGNKTTDWQPVPVGGTETVDSSGMATFDSLIISGSRGSFYALRFEYPFNIFYN